MISTSVKQLKFLLESGAADNINNYKATQNCTLRWIAEASTPKRGIAAKLFLATVYKPNSRIVKAQRLYVALGSSIYKY